MSMYLPPKHPIIAIGNNGIQNGRRIDKKGLFVKLKPKNAKGSYQGKQIGSERRFIKDLQEIKKVAGKLGFHKRITSWFSGFQRQEYIWKQKQA